MILKGAPVIHARTLKVDFRSKLLIRPIFFSEIDADFCYQVAVDSTRFRELAPRNGRIIYYARGDYVVVGKTAVFADLFLSCGLPPKFDHVDTENGRNAYGFVGVAFKREDIKIPFVVDDNEILKIYTTQIAKRWNEELGTNDVFESYLSEIIDINVTEITNVSDEFVPLLRNKYEKIAIDDTTENRNKILFAAYIIVSQGHDISLCTSLFTEKAIRESCFNVVTCENASTVLLKKITNENNSTFIIEGEKNIVIKKDKDNKRQIKFNNMPKDEIEEKNKMARNRNQTKISHISTNNQNNSCNAVLKLNKVKSFDDILNENKPPSDDSDEEDDSSFKKNKKLNIYLNEIMTIGPILGIAAGIIFILVEIKNRVNPIVIALTGLCIVVFAGLEARKIIEGLKK